MPDSFSLVLTCARNRRRRGCLLALVALLTAQWQQSTPYLCQELVQSVAVWHRDGNFPAAAHGRAGECACANCTVPQLLLQPALAHLRGFESFTKTNTSLEASCWQAWTSHSIRQHSNQFLFRSVQSTSNAPCPCWLSPGHVLTSLLQLFVEVLLLH